MHTQYLPFLLTISGLAGLGSCVPLVVTPGNVSDIHINYEDTLNSTNLPIAPLPATGYSPFLPAPYANHTQDLGGNSSATSNSTSIANSTSLTNTTYTAQGNGVLSLNLVNKMDKDNMFTYLTGLDSEGHLVILGQDGSWVYPSTSSGVPVDIEDQIDIPLGKPNSTLPITIPGYIDSARLWVSEGTLKFYIVSTGSGTGLVEPAAVNPNDPNAGVNYAFVEFDWAVNNVYYGDISYVDFVGLPLGLEIMDSSNNVQSVLGTPSNAAPLLCKGLQQQAAKDGQPWDQLCIYDTNNDLVRVLSPQSYLSSNSSAFQDYFTGYVDHVWNYYSQNALVINTQTNAGNVSCKIVNDELSCAGDNRGYTKPTAGDILGCNSGPFAIESSDNDIHLAVVPRLCAAINRGELLVPGGNIQPSLDPSKYYTNEINNQYSRLVHSMESSGRGYAFSYDDVALDFQDSQAGLISASSPTLMTVIVGGI